MLINNVGIILPMWAASLYKAAMHVNFISLPFFALLEFLDKDDKRINKIDYIYLEAIIVSFGFRGMLYVFSAWGLNNRWDILLLFGLIQLGYFIFDVKRKLRDIETNLL